MTYMLGLGLGLNKYVFAIMKLDVPCFLVKKTNILHFYSVHRKKTYLL